MQPRERRGQTLPSSEVCEGPREVPATERRTHSTRRSMCSESTRSGTEPRERVTYLATVAELATTLPKEEEERERKSGATRRTQLQKANDRETPTDLDNSPRSWSLARASREDSASQLRPRTRAP